jgi:hypothetical protein
MRHVDAAWLEHALDPLHQLVRLMHECGNPPAPHAIGCVRSDDCVEIDIVQIRLDRGDVADATLAPARLEDIQKPSRSIDGDDTTGRADDVCQIQRSVARPASEIENRLSQSEPGTLPRVEHARTPHRVLHAEPAHFLVVSPEQVVAVAAQR